MKKILVTLTVLLVGIIFTMNVSASIGSHTQNRGYGEKEKYNYLSLLFYATPKQRCWAMLETVRGAQ